MYQQVGGLQPLGFCEDVAFYDRVIYHGYQVYHCPQTLVTTSSRMDTRAPWGFGAELKSWQQEDANGFYVEGLAALLHFDALTKLLRGYFTAPSAARLQQLQASTGLGSQAVASLANYPTATAATHKLKKLLEGDPNWQARHPKQAVAVAYASLKKYLAQHD